MKAFPHPSLTVSDMGQVRAYTVSEGGMDLRDYFAAHALQIIKCSDYETTAKYCYLLADEMMKAREVTNG